MTQRYNKWTDYQDNILTQLVQKYGTRNWSAISKEMKKNYEISKRNGKQCRQRWFNQLDQSNQHKKWNNQEDLKLLEIQAILGTKWMDISHHFPGRSDNNVKNRFYSIVKKGIRKMCKYVNIRTTSMNVYAIKPSTLSKIFVYGASRSSRVELQMGEEQFTGLSRFTNSDYHEITQIIHCFIFDNNNQLSSTNHLDKDKVTDALNKLMEINSYFYNKQSSSELNSPQSFSDSDKKETTLEKSESIKQQIRPQQHPNQSNFQIEEQMQSQSNHYGIFSSNKVKKSGSNKIQENVCHVGTIKSAIQLNNAQGIQMILPSLKRGESQMSLNQNFLAINLEDDMNEEDNQSRIQLKFYTTPKFPTDVFNNFLQ